MWRHVNCQTLCLGARPRYNLEVDEDVKKPTKQNKTISLSQVTSLHNYIVASCHANFPLPEVAGTLTVEQACPEGAVNELGPGMFRVYKDQFCFAFAKNSNSNYPDAEKACDYHDGTLAMPKNDFINNFLEDAMSELGFTEPAWIGIKEVDGKFVYADGTFPVMDNFTPLSNPLFGAFQDCVAIDHQYGLWGKWRCTNFVLTNAYKPYICQYKVE